MILVAVCGVHGFGFGVSAGVQGSVATVVENGRCVYGFSQ